MMACVAPAVTVISASASWRWPYSASFLRAIASRSAGTPVIGAYWLWPVRTASASRACRRSSQLKSGNPWPRLTAPCLMARCDITVKMVVPTRGSLLDGIRAADADGDARSFTIDSSR